MPSQNLSSKICIDIAYGTDTAALLVRAAVIEPSPNSRVTDGRAEAR